MAADAGVVIDIPYGIGIAVYKALEAVDQFTPVGVRASFVTGRTVLSRSRQFFRVCVMGNRITSYNVCYTKLLRIGQT